MSVYIHFPTYVWSIFCKKILCVRIFEIILPQESSRIPAAGFCTKRLLRKRQTEAERLFTTTIRHLMIHPRTHRKRTRQRTAALLPSSRRSLLLKALPGKTAKKQKKKSGKKQRPIKALDKNGDGSISSVYAAMEYAIRAGVKVINLSLSAYSTKDASAIRNTVKDAKKAGTVVIGAAGNNGKDAKYYVPGNIPDAVIAGAADFNGKRIQ